MVAGEVGERWPVAAAMLEGAANESAAAAEVVVVATPWDSAIPTVKALRDPLAGRVVISMVNALVKEGREMLALVPPRGSMAVAVQAAVPDSLVAAAFHHLPASEMESLGSGLHADGRLGSECRAASGPEDLAPFCLKNDQFKLLQCDIMANINSDSRKLGSGLDNFGARAWCAYSNQRS